MLNNLPCGKKYGTVYSGKDVTMGQMIELSETMAEICHLKKKLNEIYDEKKQICDEMLDVSKQLDREISRYLRINGKKMSFTQEQLPPKVRVRQPQANAAP